MWLDKILDKFAFPGYGEDRKNPCPGCECCELDIDEELCLNCREDIEMQLEEKAKEISTKTKTWSKNAKRNSESPKAKTT